MEGEIDGELILSEGKEVEVTSDEEGFRGAWYASTIVKLPEKRSKGKFLIRYKHLLEDDNETPLIESVELSFIRPLPPQTQISHDHCFQLNEVVDALYLDGWWTGSVSQVLDHPKRYIVSFTDPPDVMECSPSNLRPHWKWVNGKWVKPSKFQQVVKQSSNTAKDAEETIPLGKWVKPSKFQQVVKQSSNTAKDAEATIQLESSDAVRSSSKRECNDCHKVVFVTSRKNEMRLSMESNEPEKSKQVKRTTPDGDATPFHTSKKFKHGSLANSSVPDAVKSSSRRHKVVFVSSRKNEMPLSMASKEPEKSKQVKRTTPDDDATPLRTLKKFKCGSLANSSFPDAVKSSSKRHKFVFVSSRKDEMHLSMASKEPEKCKQVQQTTPEDDATPEGDTPLRTSKKFKHGSLANSSLPESGKMAFPYSSYSLVKEFGLPPFKTTKSKHPKCSLKKYGRGVKFNEHPKHQGAEKMDGLKVAAATKVSEVQKVTKEVESSVTGGFPVECMSGSVTEEYSHVPEEAMNLHLEKATDGHQKEVGLLEIKQPKSVLQSTQSPSADAAAASVFKEMVPEEYRATEVESAVSGSQTMSVERADCQRRMIKVAGESGRKLRENEEQSQLCSQGMSTERTDCQRKIIKVAGESDRDLHVNEEQSQLGDFPPESEKQWNDPRVKPLELMVQSPLVGSTGDNEPEEGQDLPFVKSVPMWKEIESMQIFKVMPQTPHFRPLSESKEILREGLAFGHMLSFASLVHKTSKLTVTDPRNVFTTILDTLPEFEILGFDIKAVRDRTSKLLSMKDRHEYLEHHSKEVELQVKQCSDELTKINKEIDANYKMVRELEEKQALLLLNKDVTISQITSLEVCADDTTKGIQKVEADFESLAGSAW